ncbi:hypothetical protein DYBT9275_02287 [Dyadobacter sp. CECT 9275]|uniref:Glycosyl hydrolase family 32 N-terminal domain-containing protein n=1 Tax=Dyadobacter helix TaxID=2822344 RepID=A0A916JBB9_9BACT|nr:hypothetical protein [Dyadobacter sp. CECT 9275]CAG4999718.1 hypothetical protein DYBT9275_02287 [Dyadobacter sp. CECT 9275]
MKWTKIGQIYQVTSNYPETISHASNPVALHLRGDIYRIFYNGRNVHNKSSISFVDFDIVQNVILRDHQRPVFTFGSDSSFYSHGISLGNFWKLGDLSLLSVMSWRFEDSEYWNGQIGLLRLVNRSNLVLYLNKPLVTNDDQDDISLSYPFVIYDSGVYKMWYGSTISWSSENGEMIHVIKYAISSNGMDWVKMGIAIPYEIGTAQAFSRPCVLVDKYGYHMWYSYRSGTGLKYRIGYAYSLDGLNWKREHSLVGIDISASGWDSEMICYPFVFNHNEHRYMLYNGNEFGRTGFGLAIMENETHRVQ